MRKSTALVSSRDHNLSLNSATYTKVATLSLMKKFCGDKNYTISSVYDDAIYEYLANHRDEILKIEEEYHDKGGCANINLEEIGL